MIKFRNKFTNSIMWVADERKNEYIEAGHKLASDSVAKTTEKEEVKPKKVIKKK